MIDFDKALTAARGAALVAGEIIRQAFKKPIAFELKGDPADRLTQVDLDAQKMIREMLLKEFPEVGFLGEEEEEQPENKERPVNEVGWIVDPLDGTMNFTHRLPFCGTSIALEVDGEIAVGVMHFPLLDWVYTAVKGRGALKNGKPIHVGDCNRFEDALIAEIYSDREERGKEVQYPASLAFRKFGSAITSAAFVAEGAADATIIRCRKWDIAAAEIIVREAGGSVTVRLDDPSDPRGALTFIGSSPKIHEEICAYASEVADGSVEPG